jgi:hypothetical protein
MGGWVPYQLSSAPLYAKSTTADIEEPGRVTVNAMIFVPPIGPAEAWLTPLEKTPNIATQADSASEAPEPRLTPLWLAGATFALR